MTHRGRNEERPVEWEWEGPGRVRRGGEMQGRVVVILFLSRMGRW